MIAYRFQTLPDNPKFGVLIANKVAAPAIFLAPEEAKEIVVDLGTRITMAMIQSVVAKYYGISGEHMRSKSRDRDHVYPRWMAMLLSRELTNASLPMIGSRFGGRDHTTVMHGLSSVKAQIAANPDIEIEYEALRAKFIA